MRVKVLNPVETGKRIRSRMRRKGISVIQMMDYFGYSSDYTVYAWTRGVRMPRLADALKLASILETDLEDLLVYEEREMRC